MTPKGETQATDKMIRELEALNSTRMFRRETAMEHDERLIEAHTNERKNRGSHTPAPEIGAGQFNAMGEALEGLAQGARVLDQVVRAAVMIFNIPINDPVKGNGAEEDDATRRPESSARIPSWARAVETSTARMKASTNMLGELLTTLAGEQATKTLEEAKREQAE